MFIKQIQNTLHDSWRYILGFIVSFIVGAQIVGAIPLGIATVAKSMENNTLPNVESISDLYNLFDHNTVFFFLLFPFLVGLIALFLWNKYMHNSSIKLITTSRSKIDFKRVFFAFSFWGVILLSLSGLDIYLNPENYEYNFELNRFLILAVLAISLVPIQTSLEEYLFRGYLIQGIGVNSTKKYFAFNLVSIVLGIIILVITHSFFKSNLYNLFAVLLSIVIYLVVKNSLTKSSYFQSQAYLNLRNVLSKKWIPLLITSVTFGLMHLANPEVDKLGPIIMVYYIGTGLFLGITALMDEGIELALGFHAANNLLTALLVTADWTAFQTYSIYIDKSEPAAGFDVLIPVLVVFPLLLLVFSKVYKWSNWKDKLFGKVILDINDSDTNEIKNNDVG